VRDGAGLGSNPFSLEGEVALITGGGTGLGYGMASAFVASGARVVLTGRRKDLLVAAVERLGSAATYQVSDITDTSAAPDLIRRLGERGLPVSILVNNAGVHLKKPFVETAEPEFRSVLETHLVGAYAITRAAAPGMLARGHGSILFIASMTSFLGIPQVIAYSAAKSAYVGIVRTLASELSPRGVRVNAIAPGWIETPMLDKALRDDPPRKTKILGRTPMGRFGAPEDVGWAAVYLSSKAGSFVTGAVLPVDGGASTGF
jgi:gluconate 5-dehydrogenase